MISLLRSKRRIKYISSPLEIMLSNAFSIFPSLRRETENKYVLYIFWSFDSELFNEVSFDDSVLISSFDTTVSSSILLCAFIISFLFEWIQSFIFSNFDSIANIFDVITLCDAACFLSRTENDFFISAISTYFITLLKLSSLCIALLLSPCSKVLS